MSHGQQQNSTLLDLQSSQAKFNMRLYEPLRRLVIEDWLWQKYIQILSILATFHGLSTLILLDLNTKWGKTDLISQVP